MSQDFIKKINILDENIIATITLRTNQTTGRRTKCAHTDLVAYIYDDDSDWPLAASLVLSVVAEAKRGRWLLNARTLYSYFRSQWLLRPGRHGHVTKCTPSLKNNPTYVYCPLCNKAWPGWDMNDYKAHPDHVGSSIDFQGVFIQLDFLTPLEEEILMKGIDSISWDLSQSGRRKQNYGPKCNFKKKRLAPGDFKGFPEFSKFVQDKFKNVDILENYQTIEQCSLEYDPSRGASIDPHIDDCWVWGERIVTVNLLEDSVLTMTRFSGELTRYNLLDVSTYPPVLDEKGHLIERPLSINAYETTCSKTMATTHQHCLAPYSNVSPNINRDFVDKFDDCSESEKADIVVRIPMPKRSLLVLYGQARYSWEHSVFREDIPSRRSTSVSVTSSDRMDGHCSSSMCSFSTAAHVVSKRSLKYARPLRLHIISSCQYIKTIQNTITSGLRTEQLPVCPSVGYDFLPPNITGTIDPPCYGSLVSVPPAHCCIPHCRAG
uniref:Uncharacterized protein n=1 Tax=Timema genevievae TaxID=629358 RepID=A0A7R9PNZ0_TIMGE|nr:unnamed protein product [Timema genevievae]